MKSINSGSAIYLENTHYILLNDIDTTMSEVYFIDARKGFAIVEKLEALLEKVGVGPKSNLKGNIALKKQGGDPFVTDTTTLYKFDRYNAFLRLRRPPTGVYKP